MTVAHAVLTGVIFGLASVPILLLAALAAKRDTWRRKGN